MKNRTIIGIICILLALVTMFGIAPLTKRLTIEKVEIVRISADIPRGKMITAMDIEVVEIGKVGLQDNIIHKPEDVIGKYLSCDIKNGTNILSSYLTDKGDFAENIFQNLDGNRLAVSITISSFAGGVSGKLQNGDIVSIIVTKENKTQIPPELNYVRVITTTTATGQDKDKIKPDESGNYELPSTVTLLVNKEQAKILAEYELGGKIHLSLAYRGEEETALMFLEAQEKVFLKSEDD